LQKVLADIHLPSEAEESADPQHADHAYDTCVRWLLEQTRDQKKFSLLFEENCNYGFRRNLWGLKPVGVAVTVLALIAIAALPVLEPAMRTTAAIARNAVPGGLTSFVLLGWLFVVTPRWVEIPANAYADRLIEATNHL